MLNVRKDAFWFMKFELKKSMINLLLLIPVIFILVFVIRSFVPDYFEQPTMGLDFFLFFSVFIMSQITRPNDFQMKKISGSFYAVPFLISLNQLGVKKDVIVKYRFYSYAFIYTLFIVPLFIGIYPVFEDELSISSYLVFAIIWYCVGIYTGCSTLAYEPASHLGKNILVAVIAGPILFFGYIFIFYKWFTDGLVGWTMYIATEYQLWAIVISLILTIIGWKYWQIKMKQSIRKADYL